MQGKRPGDDVKEPQKAKPARGTKEPARTATPAQALPTRPVTRLPSLNAVRYFEVAARHGSFTLAAQELCVTQGAVSRMVQSLEEDLGVPLFHRKGRFIGLTAAGERFRERAMAKFLAEPAFRETLMTRFTMVPMVRNSAEMDKLQRAELELWRPIIKASGFTPDQ